MSIAENIKRLRTEHGLSQAEFGAIAGVTDKAVSTWEKGIKEPRMGAIQKIADHFHIKKSDIIEDESARPEMDEFTYAMHNASHELTDDEKEMLLDMVARLRKMRKDR